MRNGFLGSITTLLAGAGLALAQTAAPMPRPAPVSPLVINSGPAYPVSGPVNAGPAYPASGSGNAGTPYTTLGPEAMPGPGHFGPMGHEGPVGGCADHEGPGCLTSGCLDGDGGCEKTRFWVRGEYLLWHIDDAPVPLLVNPAPVAAGAVAAPLNVEGGVSLGDQSGFRISAGSWFDDDCRSIGSELTGFMLSRRAVNFDLVDPNNRVRVGTATTEMWGFEVNAVGNRCRIGPVSFGTLGGFRYLDLKESLVTDINGDSIRTRNQFYGAQIGGSFEWCLNCFYINGWGKVAVGDMHEAVGLQRVNGALVRPEDVGHFRRDRCAIVPEGNLNLGYVFNCHLRAFVGYSFLWLSTVARPGDQIVAAPPAVGGTFFRFHSTDVWVQGCNFGLEFRY